MKKLIIILILLSSKCFGFDSDTTFPLYNGYRVERTTCVICGKECYHEVFYGDNMGECTMNYNIYTIEYKSPPICSYCFSKYSNDLFSKFSKLFNDIIDSNKNAREKELLLQKQEAIDKLKLLLKELEK